MKNLITILSTNRFSLALFFLSFLSIHALASVDKLQVDQTSTENQSLMKPSLLSPDQNGSSHTRHNVEKNSVLAPFNLFREVTEVDQEIDSSNDDSVNKYNFIFYFLFKYKYEEEA